MAQLINKGPKYEARKKDANERNAAYKLLSAADRIAALDKKFGKDMGAAKQRAKLSGKSLPVKPQKVSVVVQPKAKAKKSSKKAKEEVVAQQ